MNRKLKALGLALCAAFALSVVSASAAQAAEHHILSDTLSGSTYLTAEAEGPQVFYATTEDPETFVSCSTVGVRNSSFNGSETTEITAEPVYGGETSSCSAVQNGGSPVAARIKSHECHYTFYGETTKDVTGNQSAPVDLICPGGGITVDVTGLHLACIEVEPNQELEGVKYYEDEANSHSLTLEAKVHGIKSQTQGVCGSETHNDGLYEGNVTVTGYEDEAHTETVDLDLLTTE